MLPALVFALGICLPALYLLLRAFDAEPAQLGEIVRQRNLLLLLNMLKLVAVVLGIGTLIALPAAWLVTRTDI